MCKLASNILLRLNGDSSLVTLRRNMANNMILIDQTINNETSDAVLNHRIDNARCLLEKSLMEIDELLMMFRDM